MSTSATAARWIATWFGCGLAPVAPGTFGSLGALIPAIALVHYAGWKPFWFAALAAVLTAPAIWAADVTAKSMARKDPGLVVVDEVLGQWISLAGAATLNWKSWTAAFLLFRLFDIWKPYPIDDLQVLPGGIGICADDIMAGVYAGICLATGYGVTLWI